MWLNNSAKKFNYWSFAKYVEVKLGWWKDRVQSLVRTWFWSVWFYLWKCREMHLPEKWYQDCLEVHQMAEFRWSIECNVFHRDRRLEEFSRTISSKEMMLSLEKSVSDHFTLRAITTSVRGSLNCLQRRSSWLRFTFGFEYVGVLPWLWWSLDNHIGRDRNLVVKDVSQCWCHLHFKFAGFV